MSRFKMVLLIALGLSLITCSWLWASTITKISARSSHTSAQTNGGTGWNSPVPDHTPPTGTVVINNNATYTTSTSVTLGISATDNIGTTSQMISNDGVFDTETWGAYSTSRNWTLSSGDGEKTVYAKFKDAAGNVSAVATDTIILDTTPPEAFTPVASPSERAEDDITVTFSTTDAASGINHYEVSLDGGAFATATSPYVVSSEGVHTVQVKAVDNLGNNRVSQINVYISRFVPTIHLSSPIGNGRQISYKVSYEHAAEITLTASDITLNKTGTADGVVSVSGTGNETRTVTISDISGEGTLGISIAAGTAVDVIGRIAPAVGPSATFKIGTGVIAVSAGSSHTAALKDDGTVWTWGYNCDGQLGDGGTVTQRTPVKVYGLTGVVAISAGDDHTVALKGDGTVWAWGNNSDGQLGDGTTTRRSTPVQVSGLSGVIAVSAGCYHTIALKDDGTVWAWGTGALGDGTTTRRTTPIQVSGLTSVTAISTCFDHTAALKNDGTVWTWGSNSAGQLGDGTTTQRLTPVQVQSLTGVIAVSANYRFTVALRNDGTVWTWGYNINGQLGDGTTTDHQTPIQISGLTGVVAISAGFSHVVVLKDDGTVWTWGSSGAGLSKVPVQVSGLTDVYKISAGDLYTIILKNDGTVWTWGTNGNGQLGDGTYASRLTPVNVVFDWISPTGTVAINNDADYATSTSVTLGIPATDNSGSVYRMMISNDGVFDTETWETYSTTKSWTLSPGDGSKTVYIKFKDAAGNESDVMTDSIILDTVPPEDFTPISTPQGWSERDVTVTFSTIDTLSGINHYEVSLDEGSFTTATSPYTVTTEGNHTVYLKAVDNAGNSRVSQVSACISRSAPTISFSKPYKNGREIRYRVSYERAVEISLTASDITLNKTGTASGVVSVSGTGNEARTVTISDVTGAGTLGISVAAGTAVDAFGRTALATGPSDTIAVGTDIIAVFSGAYHTVALRKDNVICIWGRNSDGQLGDGTTTDHWVPVRLPNLVGVNTVSAGFNHTVALKSDGTVWAWGSNSNGQLGDGTTTQRLIPVQLPGLTDVVAIYAGSNYTVALKSDGTVWDWGGNSNGQLGDGTTTQRLTPVQVTGLTNVVAISAGPVHTVALKNDGTVWNWGDNSKGQLGDGTTTSYFTPIQVTGLTGVTAVSAGYCFTVALKNDGTVWTWGYNNSGQLGDGTTTDRMTPVQVSGLNGVVAVSAGWSFVVALKDDGTVWSWGYNSSGQLGVDMGTYIQKLTPVKVSGLAGVSAVSGNGSHVTALENDGTVWAWGDDHYGQLGDGYLWSRSAPVNIVFDWTPPVGSVAINNGAAYTNSTSVTLGVSATDNTGTVSEITISNDGIFDTETWVSYYPTKSWTLSSGDGEKTVYVKFRDMSQNESDVVTNTIILDTTPPEGFTPVSTPSSWTEDNVSVTFSTTDTLSGINHYEVSLDGGAFVTATSPYVVTTEGNHIVQVKAVDNAGNSRVSQVNAYISRSAPAISIGSPYRNKLQVSYKVSYEHAADITLAASDITLNKTGTADGVVSVSGTGTETRIVTISDISGEGTLGISIAEDTATDAFGRTALSAGPSDTIEVGQEIVSVSAGGYHTVALRNDGVVLAWGSNNYGQLGDGTKTQRPVPAEVIDLTGVAAVSAGNAYTVALKDDGTVWAWGDNSKGQLGDGTTTQRLTPVQVTSLTGVSAVSAGVVHTVALKDDGTVWTWGDNSKGQLGDGTTTGRQAPLQVSGLTGVIAISAGYNYTVALKDDGTVWTWGYNCFGMLGDGTTTDKLTPVQVTGLSKMVAISANCWHTVALKNDGTVWAWGYNGYGQLGDGTTTQRLTPVQVTGLSGVISVSAGVTHVVALKDNGTVWSWGDNWYGQLGDGTVTQRLTPVQVTNLTGVTEISALGSYTVALKDDCTVWAWGNNWSGQLGDGTIANRSMPVMTRFDWTPPTGTVVINNNAARTNSRWVTLSLMATNTIGTISQMKISNDGVFDTENWETYSTAKSWTLPTGDGEKTVYVKFRDIGGIESDVATDTIILDTTGSLHVTIQPADAVAAGAQWRRVGTSEWKNSGDTESGVPAGTCEIEFRKIPGWDKPANAVVTIKTIATSEVTTVYVRTTISKIKESADGTSVSINGSIVSASFDGFFYIESDKRESGIRVEMADHTLSVGQRADISGVIITNSSGERCILADTVTPNGTGTVKPVGIAVKMLGGGKSGFQQGVKDGCGLSNIGLLIRCWGIPSIVDGNYYISDGSKAPVKLILPSGVSIDESWQYISLTGISSCEKVGDELHRVLLVRPGEVISHN